MDPTFYLSEVALYCFPLKIGLGCQDSRETLYASISSRSKGKEKRSVQDTVTIYHFRKYENYRECNGNAVLKVWTTNVTLWCTAVSVIRFTHV